MYIKNPIFILAFVANVGLLQSSGTKDVYGFSSLLWLTFCCAFLYILKGLILGKIDKTALAIGCFGVFLIAPTLFSGTDISYNRIITFLVLLIFVVTLIKVPIYTVEQFGRQYVLKTQYLLLVAFVIYLASQLGLISLYRFVSWGTRFGGFSFELVDHIIVCTTALLILLSRPLDIISKKYYRLTISFLVLSLLLGQSNMMYVLFISWIQILIFRFLRIRHQSALLVLVMAGSIFFLDRLIRFIPSVRGGVGDVSQRLDGARQLISLVAERVQFFSFEFFQLDRACLNSTGTNNLGFINIYCDFGLFGLVVVVCLFFALERYYSCGSRQGFYLSVLAAFSINSILIVPFYYNPTIVFALIYAIRTLGVLDFRAREERNSNLGPLKVGK